jgi:hypothetical protein
VSVLHILIFISGLLICDLNCWFYFCVKPLTTKATKVQRGNFRKEAFRDTDLGWMILRFELSRRLTKYEIQLRRNFQGSLILYLWEGVFLNSGAILYAFSNSARDSASFPSS